MDRMIIKNIGKLIQIREPGITTIPGSLMSELPYLENAYLLIENGTIKNYGPMAECPTIISTEIDAKGGYVMPTFVDAHTHIVFAEYRDGEFVDRLKGLSYEEISENGGGILNSAKLTQQATEDQLFTSALSRLNEIISLGTGAVEIKSGYGLTVESELTMLRVIKRLKDISPIPIKATFLGAHAIPQAYKSNRQGYIELIIKEMLPKIAKESLADYIDVFCENGFFTPEETALVLTAGAKYGLKSRVHANELALSGGVQVGVAHNALSVDHLECMGPEEISALQNSTTIPMLLPATAFFLNIEYAPARTMIQADLPVGLSTDYNPGTSPSGSMPFVISLACIHMKMLPEEAINAATINSAAAIELSESHGSITIGKAGSVIITKPVNSIAYLPYAFGTNWIAHVIVNGMVYSEQ